MIITEFYRQRIAKIEKEIRRAENERDFKKVVALMKEKADMKERARQDGANL